MYRLLDRINSPSDVKRLSIDQLPELADELRDFLVRTIRETGGHLASNLGVVELTIALVYVYDFPQDKVIWDVGHQSYVYKILTGRRERLDTMRSFGGMSGFPDRRESRYDVFNTGHSSTSLSAALGLARARELNKGVSNVLAVIGDGALTGGMAWEALNDLGSEKLPVAIVLNDNEMSIDRNVGGLSRHLGKFRLSRGYIRFKSRVRSFARKVPPVYRFLKRVRDNLKMKLVHGKIFEQLGLTYLGPIDGHDVRMLVKYFESLKEYRDPVLLHVLTRKGKGCSDAENDPTAYHGLPCASDSLPEVSFSHAFGRELCALAKEDSRVVAVTAAMSYGTGLTEFSERYPDRLFDVGIAEQHAVTMAAGMAVGGFHPFVAIYSTFLQRAYDQILHDVCLQDLPVTFCVDRAGVSNGDGATHHGVYDLGYLTAAPDLAIYAPKNPADLCAALRFALNYPHPFAIRYPKDCCLPDADSSEFAFGKWEILRPLADAVVLTYGDRMLRLASEATSDLGVGLVNAAFINPFDEVVLQETLTRARIVVVLEDAVSTCGLFARVAAFAVGAGTSAKIVPMGLPNRPLPFGNNDRIFEACGITASRLRALCLGNDQRKTRPT